MTTRYEADVEVPDFNVVLAQANDAAEQAFRSTVIRVRTATAYSHARVGGLPATERIPFRILRRGALDCLVALPLAVLASLIHPALGFAVAFAGLTLLFLSWFAFWNETNIALIGARALTMLITLTASLTIVSLVAALTI